MPMRGRGDGNFHHRQSAKHIYIYEGVGLKHYHKRFIRIAIHDNWHIASAVDK